MNAGYIRYSAGATIFAAEHTDDMDGNREATAIDRGSTGSGSRRASDALTGSELRVRIDDFLREALRERSPETIGTYRRSLNEFDRWVVRRRENQFRLRQTPIRSIQALPDGGA